jgi:hypothetical protein
VAEREEPGESVQVGAEKREEPGQAVWERAKERTAPVLADERAGPARSGQAQAERWWARDRSGPRAQQVPLERPR